MHRLATVFCEGLSGGGRIERFLKFRVLNSRLDGYF